MTNAIPQNRTFYVIVDQQSGIAVADAGYDKANAERLVREWREEGYSVGYQAHTEAEAYGADFDPAMYANPEARRPSRGPKVGRRYPLLRG